MNTRVKQETLTNIVAANQEWYALQAQLLFHEFLTVKGKPYVFFSWYESLQLINFLLVYKYKF